MRQRELDDRQAEADACMVGADPLAAALKRLDKRGNQLWIERLASVLDGERPIPRISAVSMAAGYH